MIGPEQDVHRQWLERLYAGRRDQQRQREHELAVAARVDDPGLLARLVAAGFDARHLPLLPLLPLVEVAWSGGAPDARQRRRLLDLASETHLRDQPETYQLLVEMLVIRPGPELFAAAEEALGLMMLRLQAAERQGLAAELRSLRSELLPSYAGGHGTKPECLGSGGKSCKDLPHPRRGRSTKRTPR